MNRLRIRVLVIFIPCFATFLVACVWIANQYHQSRKADEPSPGARIDSASFLDLGDRTLGEVVTVPYRVSNDGLAALELDHFSTSCACTGIEKSVDGQRIRVQHLTIPPLSSVELSIRLGVRGNPGEPAHYSCRFRTNDPRVPVAQVTLQVSNVTGVTANPTAIIMNSTSMGESVVQDLSVMSFGTANSTITSLQASDSSLIEILSDSSSLRDALRPNQQFLGRYQVKLKPQKAGNYSCAINLSVSSGMKVTDLIIPVTVQVAHRVSIMPTSMTLPRISSSGPIYEFTCLIRSSQGEPISISQNGLPKGFTITILDPDEPAPRKLVKIQWNPKSERTDLSQEIPITLIATSTHGQYPVTVTVRCQGGR